MPGVLVGDYTTINESDVSKWFDKPSVIEVPAQTQELLVEYAGIPAANVESHVLEVRDKAWTVHPYPCIGQFRFLELNLAGRDDANIYQRLLKRLKAGGRFLDVGCCLGQDVRKLVFDGVPRDNVVGAELDPGFIELGYELFRDRGRAPRMVQLNILEEIEDGPLRDDRGTFDVVQLGMMLHILSWDEQLKAFENAAGLLRGERGCAIIGQATGHVDGIEISNTPSWTKGSFRHNVETLTRLVRELEIRTWSKWEVRAELDDGLGVNDGHRVWDDPGTRRILFEITRV